MAATLSRRLSAPKKTEMVSFRLSDTEDSFVTGMIEYHGFKSASDFMRYLIDQERRKFFDELTLMAQALRVQVIIENNENTNVGEISTKNNNSEAA